MPEVVFNTIRTHLQNSKRENYIKHKLNSTSRTKIRGGNTTEKEDTAIEIYNTNKNNNKNIKFSQKTDSS